MCVSVFVPLCDGGACAAVEETTCSVCHHTVPSCSRREDGRARAAHSTQPSRATVDAPMQPHTGRKAASRVQAHWWEPGRQHSPRRRRGRGRRRSACAPGRRSARGTAGRRGPPRRGDAPAVGRRPKAGGQVRGLLQGHGGSGWGGPSGGNASGLGTPQRQAWRIPKAQHMTEGLGPSARAGGGIRRWR